VPRTGRSGAGSIWRVAPASGKLVKLLAQAGVETAAVLVAGEVLGARPSLGANESNRVGVTMVVGPAGRHIESAKARQECEQDRPLPVSN